MFAVKGPKPRPVPQQEKGQQQRPQQPQQLQQQQPQMQQQPPTRPIIQYGPANGSMPPPPSPMPIARSPSTTTQQNRPAGNSVAPAQNSPRPSSSPQQQASPGPQSMSPAPPPSAVQPGGQNTVPNATPGQRQSPAPNSTQATGIAQPPRPAASPAAATPSPKPTAPAVARPPGAPSPSPSASGSTSQQGAPARKPSTTPGASPAPAAAKPAANDPVIALLAQKASGDPELRDLMKRVAVGQAKDGELAHFQKIIDQLNAEYKRKGGQQGPSADRLLVDGRTVKYFADEVRTILDIVLASNPNQKSTELRPPPGSDPLVVLLVKTALEDQRTRDMIRRIAEGRPGFTDATDLKDILDRLHRDAKTIPQGIGAQQPARQVAPNGAVPNAAQARPQQTQMHAQNPQALRSKGPPPSNRPDVAAVVFDFGTGDRYLFPKYSILEYLPTSSGQQVLASFLIVRKGSISEYGGDPELDYYQPVTIRLQTQTGRHLENLARVVAPQDEVRRYMDDVMDNMTRAEYILLAMRLPRTLQDSDEEQSNDDAAERKSPSPKAHHELSTVPRPQVLWGGKSSANGSSGAATPRSQLVDPEEEVQQRYQRLIRSVEEKEYEYV